MNLKLARIIIAAHATLFRYSICSINYSEYMRHFSLSKHIFSLKNKSKGNALRIIKVSFAMHKK